MTADQGRHRGRRRDSGAECFRQLSCRRRSPDTPAAAAAASCPSPDQSRAPPHCLSHSVAPSTRTYASSASTPAPKAPQVPHRQPRASAAAEATPPRGSPQPPGPCPSAPEPPVTAPGARGRRLQGTKRAQRRRSSIADRPPPFSSPLPLDAQQMISSDVSFGSRCAAYPAAPYHGLLHDESNSRGFAKKGARAAAAATGEAGGRPGALRQSLSASLVFQRLPAPSLPLLLLPAGVARWAAAERRLSAAQVGLGLILLFLSSAFLHSMSSLTGKALALLLMAGGALGSYGGRRRASSAVSAQLVASLLGMLLAFSLISEVRACLLVEGREEGRLRASRAALVPAHRPPSTHAALAPHQTPTTGHARCSNRLRARRGLPAQQGHRSRRGRSAAARGRCRVV